MSRLFLFIRGAVFCLCFGVLVFAGSAVLTAPAAPSTARDRHLTQTEVRLPHAQPLLSFQAPLAPTPTPAPGASGAQACDPNPTTCANSITGGFNHIFQIALIIVLEIVSGGAILGFAISAAKGVVGLSTGEPRAIAAFVGRALGIVFFLICAIKGPDLLELAITGSGAGFQLPNINTLFGG